MVGVRQDDGGMVISDLREKIERVRSEGRRIKCIYTIPNFQNPSGVTLAADRRNELVQVAEEHDLLIIEDDAYFDLYFTEEASRLVPLAALHPNRVAYLGTFSKVLAPGLRTAWLRGLVTSFDHVVSQRLQRVGYRKAKGCGGLEIDDKFVLEWKLNRQIAGIYASQNLINVGRGRTRLLQLIDAVRH